MADKLEKLTPISYDLELNSKILRVSSELPEYRYNLENGKMVIASIIRVEEVAGKKELPGWQKALTHPFKKGPIEKDITRTLYFISGANETMDLTNPVVLTADNFENFYNRIEKISKSLNYEIPPKEESKKLFQPLFNHYNKILKKD